MALTNEFLKYHELSANTSSLISNPKVLKYLIINTAVVLVFPSQNGCICHMFAVKEHKCFIDSSKLKPLYEKFFSCSKSYSNVSFILWNDAYVTVSPFNTHSFLIIL